MKRKRKMRLLTNSGRKCNIPLVASSCNLFGGRTNCWLAVMTHFCVLMFIFWCALCVTGLYGRSVYSDDESSYFDENRSNRRRIRHDGKSDPALVSDVKGESAETAKQLTISLSDYNDYNYQSDDGTVDDVQLVVDEDAPSPSSNKPVDVDENVTCDCNARSSKMATTSGDVTIDLRHRILDVSVGITTGVTYQVIIRPNVRGMKSIAIISEDSHGQSLGFFHPARRKNCPNSVHIERNLVAAHEILLNWSLPISSNSLILSTTNSIIFRLCYKLAQYNQTTFETIRQFPLIEGCIFRIRSSVGSFQSTELLDASSTFGNCTLKFSVTDSSNNSKPERRKRQGLMVKLTKLNVRCDIGYVKLSYDSDVKLCGKLEGISSDRSEHYFAPSDHEPTLAIVGKVFFAVSYQRVDYCHNVILNHRSDHRSVLIRPVLKIFCNFKIALPYGYRAAIHVRIGWYKPTLDSYYTVADEETANGTDSLFSFTTFVGPRRSIVPIILAADVPDVPCFGVFIRFWENRNSSYYCDVPDDRDTYVSEFNALTSENVLSLRLSSELPMLADFQMSYDVVSVPEITKNCPFYSVAVNGACYTLIDNTKLDWNSAEKYCVEKAGHLASITDERSQYIVDQMILKSPNYQDHNSYWIGATDIGHEGDFRWINLRPFTYTNWFGGWPQFGYYNRQPNDDGFSNQNCVELRRQYQISPAISGSSNLNEKGARLTASFMWNDRDCRVQNYFICENSQKIPNESGKEEEAVGKHECNQKIVLSAENSRTVISSPDFPHNYPDNKNCHIQLTAPPNYNIILVFEEFVLEDEPNCSYDYLEVYDERTKSESSTGNVNFSSDVTEEELNYQHQNWSNRFCGDWSDRLKLLRYVSSAPKMYLHFVSDYSHSFSGFKAHVFVEKAMSDCVDNRLQLFNNVCYLFVSYPQVTWQTAQDICTGIQGNLASVHSLEEEHFIITKIRESHEYTGSTIYWLGGVLNQNNSWTWIDNTTMAFTAWLPVQISLHSHKIVNSSCLGIQWISSPSSTFPSGLYWVPVSCQQTGGYVCKLEHQSKIWSNLNVTVNGTEGSLLSPNYPGYYYHNMDYWVRIIGPETTRIIIEFEAFDLEDQKYCLYDFLEIYDVTNKPYKTVNPVRRCGYHSHQLHRLNFVSTTNEVLLRFHSDYSIARTGYLASWKAVDISGCPIQTLTAKEGIIISPNYPNFLIANLQCTTTILAPVGRQVWLEFLDWDFGEKSKLEENIVLESDLSLFLGNKEKVYPYQHGSVLTDGAYLSYGEYIKILFRTGDMPAGNGFKAKYKTVSLVKEERVIKLDNSSSGFVYHLNYPLQPISGIHYIQRFIAPLGYSIHMQFYHVVPSLLDRQLGKTVCPDNEAGFIEVRDNYADQNGTWWQFCETFHADISSHLTIISHLNTLSITQASSNQYRGIMLNASLTVIPDPNFKMKILQFPKNYSIESCEPNPCNNGGRCVVQGESKHCQCIGYFTGMFCALTICDVSPCVFGTCRLTKDSFKCDCESGYRGTICDTKIRPCSANPCEGRGICIEKNDVSFSCQCHAWWEGERCERKIVNIPYKPLTDRMLEEPFWLGLLTVCVVLACIGLFWCAKRHFPEKLEKLLAEEAERNRHGGVAAGRAAPLRAEFLGHNGIATNVGTSQTNTTHSSPNPNSTRTFFGKLGIRKPSLFSLTSPLQPIATHTTNRTFSLDDLFKPSLSRSSQSSYKSKNESGLRAKRLSSGSDQKDIGQMRPSSSDKEQPEYIPLKVKPAEKATEVAAVVTANGAAQLEDGNQPILIFPKIDPNPDDKTAASELNKLEKKVTFARLLNKVRSEMSSGSEIELSIDQNENKLNIEQHRHHVKSSSVHSTSSNQGSDSLSGSEVTLMTASGEKLNARRPSLLTLGTPGKCQKAVSADSILAMFRKFSLGTGPPSSECNSNYVSASTTPTAASTPPEENLGSLDSISSYHITPLSASSAANESPPCANRMHSSTIQVPVLDPLSHNQKNNLNPSASNLLHPPTILLEVPNKCLSPIHEVPTPIPSPSISPVFGRHYLSNAFNTTSSSADSLDSKGTPNTCKITVNESAFNKTVPLSTTVQKKPPQQSSSSSSTEGYPQITITNSDDTSSSVTWEEATKSKTDSGGTIGNNRKPTADKLVIPILTVQQPSPTTNIPPIVVICPDTPPEASLAEVTDNERSPPIEVTVSPPMITVTCMSELDSDTDSPANNKPGQNGSSSGMCYLSPFSMCSRADRIASESNLSSSGYSSMASPGPSRCGSNNPLCPSETEEQLSSGCPNNDNNSRKPPSPLLRTVSAGSSGRSERGDNMKRHSDDSETLSDDHQMESNDDEGFVTDNLDEKIQHGEVKSAKELENYRNASGDPDRPSSDSLLRVARPTSTSLPLQPTIKHSSSVEEQLESCVVASVPARNRLRSSASTEQGLDRYKLHVPSSSPSTAGNNTNKGVRHSLSVAELAPKSASSLQLPPSIVVVDEGLLTDGKSPVSSRSESPVSDRTTSLARFSPMFYGKLTDSDGLYDCTSSDCLKQTPHRKHLGRRREKYRSKSPALTKTKPESPAPLSPSFLDVPSTPDRTVRRLSPKRRTRSQQITKASTSSSSSSESCSSKSRSYARKTLSPCHMKQRFLSKRNSYSTEASGEDNAEELDVKFGHSAPNLAMSTGNPKSEENKDGTTTCSTSRTPPLKPNFLSKLNSAIFNDKHDNKDATRIPLLSHINSATEDYTNEDNEIGAA